MGADATDLASYGHAVAALVYAAFATDLVRSRFAPAGAGITQR